MAAAEWKAVQLEEKQNEQLLDLSGKILELTDAIHRLTVAHTGLGPGRESDDVTSTHGLVHPTPRTPTP